MTQDINDIAAKVAELVMAARLPEALEGVTTIHRVHTSSDRVYDFTPAEYRRFKRMLREASSAYAKENPNRHERRAQKARAR